MTARTVDVVVLNGGSSSGKSTIARRLQMLLPDTWLTLGVDDLLDAMPLEKRPTAAEPAIEFGADGAVLAGDAFRTAEVAWYRGLAAIAGAGTGVIVDEVFLGGAGSQERLRAALAGLRVLWVGVQCDPEVAAARESLRLDRVPGMARSQAQLVHAGVRYDLQVETTDSPALDCARLIAARVMP